MKLCSAKVVFYRMLMLDEDDFLLNEKNTLCHTGMMMLKSSDFIIVMKMQLKSDVSRMHIWSMIYAC